MKKFLFSLIALCIFLFSTITIAYGTELEIPVWNQKIINEETNKAIGNEIKKTSDKNINDLKIKENSENNSNELITDKIEDNSNIIKTSTDNINNQHSLKPIKTTETNNSLNLTSGGAILIEQNSGKILYDYNMHEKLRPASVTKVMTILLIMEALDSGQISLSDKVPCTEDSAKMGGSQIWLNTTEELTVDEMLKAICVVSANDCTVAMANYLAGSQEAFVEKMNQRAKDLGMNDTTFKNCHGIDEDGHVTSAYDIAVMSRELLMNHPKITEYTTIYMDSLRDGKSQLVNTNKLVRNYEGCTGLKTGSTSIALFNLSASATRNGLDLIAVIMRAETSKIRFSEASKLLNYGFGNYQYKQIAKKGEIVGECTVNKGLKPTTNAIIESDFGFITNKNDKEEIEQNVEIYSNVFAPIQTGQKVGEIIYKTKAGEEIGKVNLITTEEIDKYGFGTMTRDLYKKWFTLLRN
ncbi:MAG: D-alanyl-D-alanine carboxypeptidase [Clostridia bacterium]|nr:D-alanyl-D-alanine carboxypeptidase [Clostridia bacterium]